MTDNRNKPKIFRSAGEDVSAADRGPQTPQTCSPSYRLAYTDPEFMVRDELRAVRLQLELLKPEMLQVEHNIHSTIVIFGGTRIPDADTAAQRLAQAETALATAPDDPDLQRTVRVARGIADKSHYYEEARKLAHRFTVQDSDDEGNRMVVVTGGGPGIMEAANRGAHEAGGKSIGLNIVLPREQSPNAYITPELCFQFHYFAIRKMHFLMRARALVAFPGGFGTLDELFETLTLIQTKKIEPVPVLLFGTDYWQRIIDFEALAEEGAIDPEDLDLFRYVDSAEDAFRMINEFWASRGQV